MIVVNKPGGAGAIGWNELAGAPPDGYTLAITSVEIIMLPLYGSSKYNYPTALEPLAQVASSSVVMTVQAEQPWQDVAALIKYAKQHPGQLKFSHSGIGSVLHVAGEAFARAADITLEQVPFRGGSEATVALLGGHVQIAFINPASVKEQIKNGAVRALAVTGGQRMTDPVFAGVPTFKEQGFDIIFDNWHDVAAPKDLPAEVRSKLAEGFKAMINDPEVKKNIENTGQQVSYLDPKYTEAKWIADSQKFAKTVQETGILERIKAQKQ